jgi:predicted NAD/FAD-binding protein
MVYNSVNYPNLCAFFEEIDIKGVDTTMGFSVSIDNGKFEWCSDSLQGLLANPSNLVNKDFYFMFKDIFRFFTIAEHYTYRNITRIFHSPFFYTEN